MPRPVIELKDINVNFSHAGGTLHAVSHVDLTIMENEIFGIVGPSGAGKSTLVRVINLLQQPTSGQVIIDGQDITSLRGSALSQVRRRIGMIFQHFNLIGGATIAKNVAFNLKAAGWKSSDIPARVSELLELVGLQDKSDVDPSQLSGGQKQRVAIARALANNPSILLCDEATSALDPETAEEIVTILQDINRKMHLTIVFITHQMDIARKLFGRIAVMEKGSVVEVNDTYTLFTEPQHESAKKLVARVMDIGVPPELQRHPDEILLKISYVGERAYDPVISTVIKTYDVDLSIIHGKIEYIDNKPFGILLVTLHGSKEARDAALAYLQAHTHHVEEVSEG